MLLDDDFASSQPKIDHRQVAGGDSALPTPSTLPNVFYPKSNDRYYIFGTICQIVKKPHMARRRFPMCAILILSPCFPKPYGDHFRQ